MDALQSCLTENDGYVHIDGNFYYHIRPKHPFASLKDYWQPIPQPLPFENKGQDITDIVLSSAILVFSFIGLTLGLWRLKMIELCFYGNKKVNQNRRKRLSPKAPKEGGYNNASSELPIYRDWGNTISGKFMNNIKNNSAYKMLNSKDLDDTTGGVLNNDMKNYDNSSIKSSSDSLASLLVTTSTVSPSFTSTNLPSRPPPVVRRTTSSETNTNTINSNYAENYKSVYNYEHGLNLKEMKEKQDLNNHNDVEDLFSVAGDGDEDSNDDDDDDTSTKNLKGGTFSFVDFNKFQFQSSSFDERNNVTSLLDIEEVEEGNGDVNGISNTRKLDPFIAKISNNFDNSFASIKGNTLVTKNEDDSSNNSYFMNNIHMDDSNNENFDIINHYNYNNNHITTTTTITTTATTISDDVTGLFGVKEVELIKPSK